MTTALVDRPRRSHSQLSDFVRCSWAYRLKRVKKVAEIPSVWLAAGKSFHELTEEIDRFAYAWGIVSAASAYDAGGLGTFDDHLDKQLDELRLIEPDEKLWRTAGRPTKEKPDGESVSWWRNEGPEMVRRYIEWRSATDDVLAMAAVAGGPGIEVEVETQLGGVPVIGYVDRVLLDRRTGELIVVDLKTGSRKPDSAAQLGQYSVQLEQQYGVHVIWGAYYDARNGVLGDPVDLSQYSTSTLGVQFRALDTSVRLQLFLPNIGDNCRTCGFRASCVFAGGKEPA